VLVCGILVGSQCVGVWNLGGIADMLVFHDELKSRLSLDLDNTPTNLPVLQRLQINKTSTLKPPPVEF